MNNIMKMIRAAAPTDSTMVTMITTPAVAPELLPPLVLSVLPPGLMVLHADD